jgi:DNA-binding response OmpR family regulator
MRLLKHKRILLIEDESLILLHLTELVSEYGYQIAATAGNLSDGLAKARVVNCDLALLDVDLHGEKCFSIAKTLLSRGVPFAFVTGYDDSVIPKRFARVPTIHKPLTEGELKRTLQSLVANA